MSACYFGASSVLLFGVIRRKNSGGAIDIRRALGCGLGALRSDLFRASPWTVGHRLNRQAECVWMLGVDVLSSSERLAR